MGREGMGFSVSDEVCGDEGKEGEWRGGEKELEEGLVEDGGCEDLFDGGVEDVAVREGQHILEKPDGELVGEERFDTFWDVERHKFEDL